MNTVTDAALSTLHCLSGTLVPLVKDQRQAELTAEFIYGQLELLGYTGSAQRSEVHDRLMCGCATVVPDKAQGVRAFCSLHDEELITVGDVELGCRACGEALQIAGADMAEAEAMRKADCVAENGLENFEENYPYYLVVKNGVKDCRGCTEQSPDCEKCQANQAVRPRTLAEIEEAGETV